MHADIPRGFLVSSRTPALVARVPNSLLAFPRPRTWPYLLQDAAPAGQTEAVSIRKHLDKNRKDKDAKFRLILVESRIHRLARCPLCVASSLLTLSLSLSLSLSRSLSVSHSLSFPPSLSLHLSSW